MESTRRASSLPSGVFRVGSPKVERALATGIGDLFLRHMVRTDRSDQLGEVFPPCDPEVERRNHVDGDELGALVSDLRRRDTVAAPVIDARLAAERTWILLNLAAHGSPRFRELAQGELLDVLSDGSPSSADLHEQLRAMVAAIDDAERDGRLDEASLAAVRAAAARRLDGSVSRP